MGNIQEQSLPDAFLFNLCCADCETDFSRTGKIAHLWTGSIKKKQNSDTWLLLIHSEILLLEAWNGKPYNVMWPTLDLSEF